MARHCRIPRSGGWLIDSGCPGPGIVIWDTSIPHRRRVGPRPELATSEAEKAGCQPDLSGVASDTTGEEGRMSAMTVPDESAVGRGRLRPLFAARSLLNF